jgi:hypothetical protein
MASTLFFEKEPGKRLSELALSEVEEENLDRALGYGPGAVERLTICRFKCILLV